MNDFDKALQAVNSRLKAKEESVSIRTDEGKVWPRDYIGPVGFTGVSMSTGPTGCTGAGPTGPRGYGGACATPSITFCGVVDTWLQLPRATARVGDLYVVDHGKLGDAESVVMTDHGFETIVESL